MFSKKPKNTIRDLKNILVLFPYLVTGSLMLKIIRSLRKSFEFTVLYRYDASGIYPIDPADDFSHDNALLDYRYVEYEECTELLNRIIIEKNINLVIQVGAIDLYHLLPYIKETNPKLKFVDILYNKYGHTINHFLYDKIFDGVIVESEHMMDFIKSSSNANCYNLKVLTSGIDLSYFNLLNEPNKDGTAFIIGYLGRLSDEKNPLGFIDIAERIGAISRNVSFKIFGTGDQLNQVIDAISLSKVSNLIEYAGFIDDVRDALNTIDLLIVPSKFDGRPVVIMEANACGVPVIAANVGGIPELIENGVNGYLFDKADNSTAAAIAIDLVNNASKFNSIKCTTRKYAEAHFDELTMVKSYQNYLLDILQA